MSRQQTRPAIAAIGVNGYGDSDSDSDSDATGMKSFAEDLLVLGVVCLPIPEFASFSDLEWARAQLDIEITAFPEFNTAYTRKGASTGERAVAEDEDEDEMPAHAAGVGRAAAMNVAALKAELRQRGLPVSGKKADLVARLSGAGVFPAAAAARPAPARPALVNINKRALVKGGFSVLGNPSSFHNEFVRDTRKILHPYARSLMQSLVGLPEFIAKRRDAPRFKFCQEIDRLMVRPIGVVPTSESWHRDSSPRALPEDIVFGGWLNLDLTPQTFTCVLGSHMKEWDGETRLGAADGVGFKPITDPLLRATLKAQSVDVIVQPGELLIFADAIVHEVHAKPRPGVSERLFTGWRLTHSDSYLLDQPLRGDGGGGDPKKRKSGTAARPGLFERMMAEGAAITVKSDQPPEMYRPFHRNKWFRELEAFSIAAFPEELLEPTEITRTRDNSGNTVPPFKEMRMYVPRVMPSLRELGFGDIYPEYTREELDLYKPKPLLSRR